MRIRLSDIPGAVRPEPVAARAIPRPRHKPGRMNRLETAWAQEMAGMMRCGLVTAWQFEPIKFYLTGSDRRTSWTPDFMVQAIDGFIWFDDVKGHQEQHSRVKAKIAADRFPMFGFRIISRRSGVWSAEYLAADANLSASGPMPIARGG